jgi:hypothetical protein
MPIPRSSQIRGMHHVRGVASVPSLSLRKWGHAGRWRETADIAAALAALRARRSVLTSRNRHDRGTALWLATGQT